MKQIKRGIAVMLAVVLVFSLFLGTNHQVYAAASKTIVVSSQKQLNAAIKDKQITKIVIKTKDNKSFKISGKLNKKSIVISAPKATVSNSAKCKGITINSAKKYTENAKNNSIKVTAKDVNIVVSKKASVKSITLDKKGAKPVITVNGTVKSIRVMAKATVTIAGTAKSETKIVVSAGAENTKVVAKNDNTVVKITNNTNSKVEVENKEGKTTSVEAGASTKVDVKDDTIFDDKDDKDDQDSDVKPSPSAKPSAEPSEEPAVEPTKAPGAGGGASSGGSTSGGASSGGAASGGGSMSGGTSEPTLDAPNAPSLGNDLDYAGYTLKWSDDFTGSELNRNDWNVETHEPGWVNSEWQEYVDSDENIYLKDGKLVIKPVRKEAKNADGTTSYAYTSGRINTQNKHDFKYGMFEVKAKVPTGKGYLPAFWMMPTNENLYGQWPRCGEIDCMEVMGQQTNKLYGTIHYGNPHSESQGTNILESGSYASEYHTFTTEWEPGKITWYVDGKKYHEENDWYSTTVGQGTVAYPAPFDQKFYMILNLAIGGSWVGYPDATTTYDDQAFVIDYVRAYQKDSYDENVTKPEKEVILRDPDANGNYINNGDFATAEDLTDDTNWKFMTANGGEATADINDNTMVVKTTNAGTVDYSVQLVQAGVPFKKGATYEVSFDAKADAARSANIAVKAPDRGYQAYMSQNVDLTTAYKTYTYDFKMSADSDANGRLEYNMGAAGSTAAVYIKNVSIKMKSDYDPNEKEEKTVLADGNYVYNGSFQEGANRLDYWTISEGISASVTSLEDGRRLKADVSTANATISQDALAFTPGQYALSFDADVTENKSVTVTACGVEKTIELTAQQKNYAVKLNIATIGDNKDFVLKFNQTGTYYLDNIRLEEDCLIKNGSFNAGTSGFDVYLYNTADATYVVDSQKEQNALDLTIKNTNDAAWKIQVKQSNVTLEEGQCYRLSFDIKSSIDRSIQYAIQRDGSKHKDADGNEDWKPYVQAVQALEAYGSEGTYTHVENCFKMAEATDTGSIFNIALGKVDRVITDQHRVCIDNIVLEKIDESEMPKEEEPEQNVGENLLKNGNFAEGGSDWSASVHEPATGAWTFENSSAQVAITNPGDADWHVGLKQTGLTLVKGATYKVTATITSNVDRQAKFACMDAGNANWYVEGDNTISLEADVAKQVSFNVKVGENPTDRNAYIAFNLGKATDMNVPDASTVKIENVSLVCVAGNAVDDATDDGDNGGASQTPATENLFTNPTFDNNADGWNLYVCGDSNFEDVVDASKCWSYSYDYEGTHYVRRLTLKNGCDSNWQIGFAQVVDGLEAGNYRIRYKIKSYKLTDEANNDSAHVAYDRHVTSAISINGAADSDYQGAVASSEFGDYVAHEFTLEESGKVEFKLFLGQDEKDSKYELHHIEIQDLELVKVTE